MGTRNNWLKVFNTTSGAEDSESLADWRIANGYAWHDQLDEPWRKSNSVNMMMELRGVLGSLHVENYSATGAPSISGLAGAGRWLRASTSGIADNNSNSYAESDYYNFGYTYQWVRVRRRHRDRYRGRHRRQLPADRRRPGQAGQGQGVVHRQRGQLRRAARQRRIPIGQHDLAGRLSRVGTANPRVGRETRAAKEPVSLEKFGRSASRPAATPTAKNLSPLG